MKADLLLLKKESESGQTITPARLASTALRSATATFQSGSKRQTYLLLGMAGLLITLVVAVGASWFKRRSEIRESAGRNTIAVLPLQNLNGDGPTQYLSFALADEIANALTYTRSLEIRPSASTRKYVGADVDPPKAGRELHVANVLTGHYIEQGNRLMVTLEAIDVKTNRVLWQSSLTSDAQDLIALQSQISSQMRQSLLPALGAVGEFLDTGTKPQNQEAYDLYLRSVSVPHDPAPNKEGIVILERAVGMDSNYARAWQALGRRYYFDAIYSGGGKAVYERSNAAYERALTLDPNLIEAVGYLAQNHVEAGDLNRAYADAADLVRRRPENAVAHFSLSYMLRYSGLLEEAQRECNTALGLDSGNYNFRSCSLAFMLDGKGERAMDFLRLDAGSEWSTAHSTAVLLGQGKIEEAKQSVQRMSDNPTWMRGFLQACLAGRPAEETDKLARQVETNLLPETDSELKYLQGALLAYCGKPDISTHFIRRAVEQNYCAYRALEADPLLAKLRSRPEFPALLAAAQECQQKFLNFRKQHGQGQR
jgi:TolB-like protein